MIKQGFLRCGRGQKKEKGEKENRAKRWCAIGSWPPAAQPNRQHKTTARLSLAVPQRRGIEEELAEEERAAGQTVRGKGSMGPGCLGEEDLLLQKSPHQASGWRPGPLRGVLPVCTEVIRGDKRDWNSPGLAQRLASGCRRR